MQPGQQKMMPPQNANPDQNPQQAYPTQVTDEAKGEEKTEKDLERMDQMMFVRKVLGIVAFQLAITFGIAIASSYTYEVPG